MSFAIQISKIRIALFLFLVTGLAVSFQNCGQSGMATDASTGNTGNTGNIGVGNAATKYERVVAHAATYSKIVYDKGLESRSAQVDSGDSRVEIDLNSGQLRLSGGGAAIHGCAIEATRLATLKEFWKTAKICEPAPLPPETISCMAISLADLELSDGGASVLMRPLLCNFGRFFCDGEDAVFRAMLKDLRDNPPSGC